MESASRPSRVLVLSFVFFLSLTLTACGRDTASSAAAPDGTAGPVHTAAIPMTEPGYISTEIVPPDWVESFGSRETLGDMFYISAATVDGSLAVAAYDTINDSWQRYDLDTCSAVNPGVSKFSASENSFWLLLRESRSDEEIAAGNLSRLLNYYLLYLDLNTKAQTLTAVDWWSESQPYFASLIALDDGRALLGDGETAYLIDPRARIMDTPDLEIMGEGLHVRVAGDIYVNTYDGLARLNPDSLQYENTIEEIVDQCIYSSSPGNFLTTKDSILYSVNPSTGEETELLSWLDVSLSYSNLYGWTGMENSRGDIFHITDTLIRVTKAQVPVKQTLVLACFGDSSEQYYDIANDSYVCSEKLLDAILKFNNSDPEFRIELRPFIYHDETERSNMLLEISTGGEIDLIDTSLLPEGAVASHLLADLLPYIDADESISREDFIAPLLNGMMKNGGLYEYTDKYTMLTMYTHPELIGSEPWTVEKIESLIMQHPELKAPNNHAQLIRVFSLAATAEFMDKSSGVCHFDDPAFAAWLSLLKTLTASDEEYDSRGSLFGLSYDFPADIGHRARSFMGGDYSAVGFPDAAEGGSYFMELGTPGVFGAGGHVSDELEMYTSGSATSLGIMSSCDNPDGAWRFLRTFILGEEEPLLIHGIPVLKEGFELAIECELSKSGRQQNLPYELFNQADADTLRKLVYNTNKIVCSDEAVIDVMTAAITAYLGGKGTAEEAARQIQSRVSIYLAEQYG